MGISSIADAALERSDDALDFLDDEDIIDREDAEDALDAVQDTGEDVAGGVGGSVGALDNFLPDDTSDLDAEDDGGRVSDVLDAAESVGETVGDTIETPDVTEGSITPSVDSDRFSDALDGVSDAVGDVTDSVGDVGTSDVRDLIDEGTGTPTSAALDAADTGLENIANIPDRAGDVSDGLEAAGEIADSEDFGVSDAFDVGGVISGGRTGAALDAAGSGLDNISGVTDTLSDGRDGIEEWATETRADTDADELLDDARESFAEDGATSNVEGLWQATDAAVRPGYDALFDQTGLHDASRDGFAAISGAEDDEELAEQMRRVDYATGETIGMGRDAIGDVAHDVTPDDGATEELLEGVGSGFDFGADIVGQQTRGTANFLTGIDAETGEVGADVSLLNAVDTGFSGLDLAAGRLAANIGARGASGASDALSGIRLPSTGDNMARGSAGRGLLEGVGRVVDEGTDLFRFGDDAGDATRGMDEFADVGDVARSDIGDVGSVTRGGDAPTLSETFGTGGSRLGDALESVGLGALRGGDDIGRGTDQFVDITGTGVRSDRLSTSGLDDLTTTVRAGGDTGDFVRVSDELTDAGRTFDDVGDAGRTFDDVGDAGRTFDDADSLRTITGDEAARLPDADLARLGAEDLARTPDAELARFGDENIGRVLDDGSVSRLLDDFSGAGRGGRGVDDAADLGRIGDDAADAGRGADDLVDAARADSSGLFGSTTGRVLGIGGGGLVAGAVGTALVTDILSPDEDPNEDAPPVAEDPETGRRMEEVQTLEGGAILYRILAEDDNVEGFAVLLGEEQGVYYVLSADAEAVEATPSADELEAREGVFDARFSSADEAVATYEEWLTEQEQRRQEQEDESGRGGRDEESGAGAGDDEEAWSEPQLLDEVEGWEIYGQERTVLTSGETDAPSQRFWAERDGGNVYLQPDGSEGGGVHYFEFPEELEDALEKWLESGGEGEGGEEEDDDDAPSDESDWSEPQRVEQVAGWYIYAQIHDDGRERWFAVGENGNGQKIYLHPEGEVETEIHYFDTDAEVADALEAWQRRREEGDTEPREEPTGGEPRDPEDDRGGWSEVEYIQELPLGWHLYAQEHPEQGVRYMVAGIESGERIYLDTDGTVEDAPVYFESETEILDAIEAHAEKVEDGTVTRTPTGERPESGEVASDASEKDDEDSGSSFLAELTTAQKAVGALVIGGVGYYAYEEGYFDDLFDGTSSTGGTSGAV